ncbi:MAG: hypothetical protein FD122_3705 [Stygiobacter sp.]|nr:MAG: hypothetical protein FD122_3705 [Stygiobacter sp.]KAF0210023.1 MAG: hypothetical protein FD178_3720 [Ignavibacteria bacterium]
MKKLFLLLFLSVPGLMVAQDNFGSVKFGMYNPSASDAGFIIGYEGGWYIDDNFMVGWSADWFHKNYVDARLVKEYNDFYGNIHSKLNELRAKTNLHSVPLMGSVTGNWSIGHRARAFVTGSAGLNVLLIFYRSYENPDNDEFQGAVDFAWRVGSGILYELGDRSDAFVELSYHHSEPSWEYEVKDTSTGRRKTFERLFDMSGVMMRVGFRFFF